MKVGGSSDWPQNGIDDSPTWGNIKSRRIFHPTLNQLTLWPFQSWILPQNTQKYDEIWQGALNFFKHIWLILCHKWPEFSEFIDVLMDIKLLTSLLASEAVEKNIFVLSIFSHLIWLQLVSGAKIIFYNMFANYLEPPKGLRGNLEAIWKLFFWPLKAKLWPINGL